LRLTPDDIVDLSRWYFIQFATVERAMEAMERYERYMTRPKAG
jgi:hypothetical protein